jgi:chromosome segregation ATPase
MDTIATQHPARARRTRRSAGVGLALVLSTSALGACGEDGSITIPEFTISSDQLDQLLDDAKAQAEAIGGDVQAVIDSLGSLPADQRAQVEEAVTAAQTASEDLQTALDEAANATEETKAAAEQRVADARARLDEASAQLQSASDAVKSADEAVSSSLDTLRGEVDKLSQEVEGATS